MGWDDPITLGRPKLSIPLLPLPLDPKKLAMEPLDDEALGPKKLAMEPLDDEEDEEDDEEGTGRLLFRTRRRSSFHICDLE